MSDNPFESTLSDSGLPKVRSRRSLLFELIVVVGVILMVFAMLIPAPRRAREASRRAGCINNTRQIGLAILNYEVATGKLPPAYTVDDDGNRLHSWRTLILPYAGRQELYDSIDLTKPWDDPVNAEAREVVVTSYLCPSSPVESHETTYLAVVGAELAFAGSVAKSLSEATESCESRLVPLIVDVPADRTVHWMSPYDTDMESLATLSDASEISHDGIVIFGFLNNHTQAVPVEGIVEFIEMLGDALQGRPIAPPF